MEFKEISTVDEMILFQLNKGRRHRNYYHYTNLDSIVKIIKSGYWHFTQGSSDKLNDQQELRKGFKEVRERIYIACFAFGDNENMAMWGLYGVPWQEAVRVGVPKSEMISWVEEISEIYSIETGDKEYRYNIIDNMDYEIKLADIIYISGNMGESESKIHYLDNSKKIFGTKLEYISDERKTTGFIKNNAWAYEQEVRLIIKMRENIDFEKIAVKIPDNLINNLKITAGPSFDKDIEQEISDKLRDYNIKFDKSDFDDLVKYRSICTDCRQGKFIRKNN